MKHIPILFLASMVRAQRDGRKTQTRRIFKVPGGCSWYEPMGGEKEGWLQDDTGPAWWHVSEQRSPYGRPGDRLRVKEAAWMWCERRPNGKTAAGRDKWLYVPLREAPVLYAADHPAKPRTRVTSPETGNAWGWRFKIGRFLPAWASRIELVVTSVRVERLQDISDADALAEGIASVRSHAWDAAHWPQWKHRFDTAVARGTKPPIGPTPREVFCALWEDINGAGSWAAAPWVWVVEFRMEARP